MSQERYIELTGIYKKFIYESYQVEEMDDCLMLNFQYKITNDIEDVFVFNHRVSYALVSDGKEMLDLSLVKDLDAFIFTIGLVESINYYKTVCPKSFHIHCGRLTLEQKKWWQKLFYHGLGEFIYLNGISEIVQENDFVKFIDDDMMPNLYEEKELTTSGNLIPVGGGKDSVVTIELLKQWQEDNLCFVMSPPKAAYDCIERAGYKNYLLAKRHFDKKMLEMNGEGYLNGHVPFSAILGFISLLGAALTGKKYIPLSNEKSANESTVIGESYNHQYSKSFEFEEDFNWYVANYLTKDIHYFSLLRPLYEVEIAQRFSMHRQYHSIFRSCNKGKKDNKWCGFCSKCLFVYIIMAPYMSRADLNNIFGKDMLDEVQLREIFLELIGKADVKPFECVGTIDEVRWSMKQIIVKKEEKKEKLTVLEKIFLEQMELSKVEPLIHGETKYLIPDIYKSLLGEKG